MDIRLDTFIDKSDIKAQHKSHCSKQHSQIPLSVCVRNANKCYGKKTDQTIVFDRLNMTVPRGVIYALLGPSGCGKTTLLNCIVGRKTVDSGQLLVLGEIPGSRDSCIPGPKIGYMPQDNALYGQFTIRETLQYFGWIAGMTSDNIKQRMDFFLNLLMLPSAKEMVKNLSSGQQRRVSLASALLHEPELLILDEPTVGLDVVVRNNIWDHFKTITQEGLRTVIITTHYIDETRHANIIALMRGGSLLAEDSPEELLNQYNVRELDDVFIKLSIDQSNKQNVANTSNGNDDQEISIPDPIVSKRFKLKICNGNHLKALLWKNFLWMMRNLRTMILILLLPLVQTVLFCACIGNDPVDLSIAVVNHEIGNSTNCEAELTCNKSQLSCNYLRYLERKNLILIPYDLEDNAIQSVLTGKTYASIIIKHNYSLAFRARTRNWRRSNQWDISSSEIDVFRDVSSKIIANGLQAKLYETFRDYFHDYMKTCDEDSRWLTYQIRWEPPIYGKQHLSYTNFVAPGLLTAFTSLLAVILTAVTILSEQAEGSLDRSLVIGISAIELFIAHAVCQFVVMALQTVITLVCLFVIYDITLKGSLILVVSLTLLTGVHGICFGFCISCACDTIEAAFTVAMASFLSMLMLCGIIWPIEASHYMLQWFSQFLPLTKVVESLRSVMQRGWGFSSKTVYMGFAYISVWTMVFLVTSILLLKFKKA